jgi:hypothetical protein
MAKLVKWRFFVYADKLINFDKSIIAEVINIINYRDDKKAGIAPAANPDEEIKNPKPKKTFLKSNDGKLGSTVKQAQNLQDLRDAFRFPIFL